MEEIVAYIIEFLLFGQKELTQRVGYTCEKSEWDKYDVVIIPNGHLGKKWVWPELDWESTTFNGDKTVIKTDIVYNTAFFISRAEEILNTKRDQHNRFLASYSILGEGDRLQHACIDEYSERITKLLGAKVPKAHLEHIYLTHDVDTIAFYRHLRGLIGGITRGHRKEAVQAWKRLEADPAYTFPWIIEQDKQVKNATRIYFLKAGNGRGYDYPQYGGWDEKELIKLLRENQCKIGLHSSYASGDIPKRLAKETTIVRSTLHRSHYLRCSIKTMQALVDYGIDQDFGMGFADKAGFRLQTTRPVRWINPERMVLSNLVMHPLTVMDCTLSNPNYMNLDEEAAFNYCQSLIETALRYAGEISLLWHNSIFPTNSYHATLYPRLIQLVRDIQQNQQH